MASITIHPNSPNYLSWAPPTTYTSQSSQTENTTVLNSSGNLVYWQEQNSTNAGTIDNDDTRVFYQGTSETKFDFSNTSPVTAKVTLSVSGAGDSPSR
jgi:hypothetical protein